MEAEAFIVCFEAHRPDGRVWGVRIGTHWEFVAHVDVSVPMRSSYRGQRGAQPIAYFEGVGIVSIDGDRALIRPWAPPGCVPALVTCPLCGRQTMRSRGRLSFLTEKPYWDCPGCLKWFSLDSQAALT